MRSASPPSRAWSDVLPCARFWVVATTIAVEVEAARWTSAADASSSRWASSTPSTRPRSPRERDMAPSARWSVPAGPGRAPRRRHQVGQGAERDRSGAGRVATAHWVGCRGAGPPP